MISILIPSRNERFLNRTIAGILASAEGDIEVIAVLDESWPDELIGDKRVTYLHQPVPKGMRAGINWAASVARGEYLLKTDGHCLYAPGFDKALAADMEDNWVVIPRRYSLDAENWAIEHNRKPPRDYHYLCYPYTDKGHDSGMHGVEWWERGKERADILIDDTPSFQGSCWFMAKTWFDNFLHGVSEEGYGIFAQEPQEIGNKTWLGGGEVKVNKKTWYAHLHKGKRYGRMYNISQREIVAGHGYSATYWMSNSWPERIHDLAWLIEKFWPMPTWPADRSLWTEEARWRIHQADYRNG